ncbi:[NiFe] hydrogenase metallocenter assembly protein HypD [hydrothermal vent metagenome]|uniref:[NiFe] hydrogenase metallocenter assembly protein HypD n=1 Tax=hydrothermal vent metagenome TaxID=652676 RepID=A0A3B1DII8_9ZZZZ
MKHLIENIHLMMKEIGRPVRLMEVCGTHTVAIFRHGIRTVLPDGILLLSGPGCPVCVTSIEDIDKAVKISGQPGVILATFGDMMRVPGSSENLQEARADGVDIRVLYSPMDALDIAGENPDRRVVFFATGFETTSPSVAATLCEADRKGIDNFYIYPNHKLVPPALKALLADERVKVDGFILPGHVSTIIGRGPYDFISRHYKKPSVIAGFEARDILEAVAMLLAQLIKGESRVEIQYVRAVRAEGNPKAISLIETCFMPVDAQWRGIGTIAESGLSLREEFRHRDASKLFDIEVESTPDIRGCACGDVLKGIKIPTDCPLYGKKCTPENPVGACMVSTEGSCSAYYKYRAGA